MSSMHGIEAVITSCCLQWIHSMLCVFCPWIFFPIEHWKHTHCCLVCSCLEQCIVSIYNYSKTLDFTLTQEAPNLHLPVSKCELTLQGFTHLVYFYVTSFFCQWPALNTVPECLQCRHRWGFEANVANMLFLLYNLCRYSASLKSLLGNWGSLK